jgi:CheY-like chemotaxis protein
VVDDNLVNRIIIRKIAQSWGASCDGSPDGEAGLFKVIEEQRKGKPFHGIFVDFNMPGMDGFETTEKLREFEASEKRARTKVAALTAMAMRADVDKALKAGCDDYLTKPIRKNTFYSYLMAFSAGRPEMK